MAALSMEYTARNTLYSDYGDTSITSNVTVTATYSSTTDTDITNAGPCYVSRHIRVSAPTPEPEVLEASDDYIPELPARPWTWDLTPEIELHEIEDPLIENRSPRGPPSIFC